MAALNSLPAAAPSGSQQAGWTETAADAAGDAPVSPEVAGRWWFEVSRHTHRVHIHAADDRSRPLRLSLPLEGLLTPAAPFLQQLWVAVERQLEHRALHAAVPPPPAVITGVGPVAVDLELIGSVADLEGAVAAAKAFATEWRELPVAPRHRLLGRLLQSPLDDVAGAVARDAEAAGALGRGTDRFLTATRPDLKLPQGAAWRQLTVRFPVHGRQHTYPQPVLPCGTRLCLHCAKPAIQLPAGADASAAVVESMCFLFCGATCERQYAMKSSGGAGRRALFCRERGVCSMCGLDAQRMVQRLQAIERGTRG